MLSVGRYVQDGGHRLRQLDGKLQGRGPGGKGEGKTRVHKYELQVVKTATYLLAQSRLPLESWDSVISSEVERLWE